MQTITTIDQLVTAFESPAILGRALGVGADTVYVWRMRRYVPPRHILALSRLARSHGIELDDALFEKPAHAATLPHSNECGTLPHVQSKRKRNRTSFPPSAVMQPIESKLSDCGGQ